MADAKSLLSAITSPEFLAALIITNCIFSYTTNITHSLQSQSRDIVKAISGIDVLCDTLQSVRDDVDTHHCRWMDETKKMCEDTRIELCIPRLCGRQQHRDNIPAETPDEYYKRNLTIPLLDHVLMEMKSRFSIHQQSGTYGLYFVPATMVLMEQEKVLQKLTSVVNLHKADLPYPESVWSGLHCWYVKWQTDLRSTSTSNSLPKSLSAALLHASEQLFPNIKTLLTILCILPVTSCSSERSNSTLKMTKTRLRCTMSDGRLTGLMLMSIHRDIDISLDEVISEFSRKHRRRMQLENIMC